MRWVYDLKREQLGQLLEQIDGPDGATLLIPNLQRPYVWQPHQVTLLMDSLLRGWPFGTLLLWRIDTTSTEGMIPSRPFWTLVDRTDERKPAEVSERHPPAQYRMVLDGQQRMQSLILAVGRDDYGFRLQDADWFRSIEGQPRPGRQPRHWSKGELFLDVPAYATQLAATNNPRDVDYLTALAWVAGDPAAGRSKTRQAGNYKYPILRRDEHPGRFVRMSRLWRLADHRRTARQLREPVQQLLTDYGVPAADLDKHAEDVAELVLLLGQVKATDVSYLELQPYRKEDYTEDAYNDAVVNIFTRLNTAGRTLTEQEISYAWIKSYWDATKTGGLQADECFTALRDELLDYGLRLDDDDVVRVVSTIWSVLQNAGELLSRRDLLQPAKAKRLAAGSNERWDRLRGSILWAAERVSAAGLEYRAHYESLNAIIVLMAWRAVASEWLAAHPLRETARDGFEKQLAEVFDRECVRWFAVTQWARVWTGGAGKPFAGMIRDLTARVASVASEGDPAVVLRGLGETLSGWMAPLVEAAASAVDAMTVTNRDHVVQYYFPLWVWHRLDPDRWERSKLAFRVGRKKVSLDVDHLAAAKAWERLIASLDEDRRAEVGPAVNQIGNCWLMEKNFNISKSDGKLTDFLAKIHEFKSGLLTITAWCDPLGVTPPLLDPTTAGVDAVLAAIDARTQVMKTELKAFVRGEKVPVS